MRSLPFSENTLSATAAFLAVTLAFGGGLMLFANPIPVRLAEIQALTEEEDPNRNRHYVTMPIELTANAPRFGATLNIEIGLAVRDEISKKMESMIRVESGQILPAITEAMRMLLEDPLISDVEAFQAEFPAFARDSLNKALSTDELANPVLEVHILKMIVAS